MTGPFSTLDLMRISCGLLFIIGGLPCIALLFSSQPLLIVSSFVNSLVILIGTAVRLRQILTQHKAPPKLTETSTSSDTKELEHLKKLRGFWLEKFQGLNEFSIGEFSFDPAKKEWRYDGTRFDANGSPRYDWKCTHFCADEETEYLMYRYELDHVSGTISDDDKTGFGMLEIISPVKDRAPTFKSGKFAASGPAKEAFSLTITSLASLVSTVNQPGSNPNPSGSNYRRTLGPQASSVLHPSTLQT